MKKYCNSKGNRQSAVFLNVSTESGSCRTVVVCDDESDLKKITSKWYGHMTRIVDCYNIILQDHNNTKKLGTVTLIHWNHTPTLQKLGLKWNTTDINSNQRVVKLEKLKSCNRRNF